MSSRARFTADETRDRILAVAEEHFRRVGYGKTAIADIANELGMSSANVYRFFSSKSAICEEIARRMLEQCHVLLREIVVDRSASAEERLTRMTSTLHRYNKAQFLDERRIHDMVEAAMTESWPVIQAHLDTLVALFAEVIREGMAAGEFIVRDPVEAAICFKQCHVSVFHPTLIADCAFDQNLDDQTARLTRFAIRALKA